MSNLQCRLCADFKPIEDLLNVTNNSTLKLDLERKIHECFNLTFEDLLLPKHVCLHCSEQVSQSFSFREKVLQAQENLQPCVNEEKIFYANGSMQIKSEYSENEDIESQHFLEPEHEDAGFKSEENCSDDEDSDFQIPLSSLKAKKNTTRKIRKKKAIKTEQVGDEDAETEIDPEKQKLWDEVRLKIQQTKEIWKNYFWKCTICDKQLPTLRDLRNHYPSSHDSNPHYACMECPNTYDAFRNFRVHVKTHRDKDKFQCPNCARTFSKNICFRAHLKTHSTERNHICAMCGKSFKTAQQLSGHRKIHAPDKFRHSCDICKKKLTSKSSLTKHLKIHQGIKDHTCEHCGKSFTQQINLKQHIEAIHRNDFAYCCSKCPKRFKTSRNLYKHLKLHNRKHECKECGNIFLQKEALDEHRRVHNDALPFQCECCPKRFKSKSYFKIHMRFHTGERPHSCADCNKRFIDPSSYLKHMKKRHRIFPIPNKSQDIKPVNNQDLVGNSITSGHPMLSILS